MTSRFQPSAKQFENVPKQARFKMLRGHYIRNVIEYRYNRKISIMKRKFIPDFHDSLREKKKIKEYNTTV